LREETQCEERLMAKSGVFGESAETLLERSLGVPTL
jgi:hypothetical protein